MKDQLQLIALGGADEVGRSCYLVGDGEKWIMFDCGKSPAGELPDFEFLDTLKDKLKAVIITHAHVDHVGALPELIHYLQESGWTKMPTIYSTPLTKILSEEALSAAAKSCAEQDLREIYRKIFGESFWETIEYDELKEKGGRTYRHIREVVQGVMMSLLNANHIPGSASVVVDWEGYVILYTGDCASFKRRYTEELSSWLPHSPKLVIAESTYGQETQAEPDEENVRESENKLVKSIRETLKNKGKVLIPIFADKNPEEIILTISEAWRKGRIPRVRMFTIGNHNTRLKRIVNYLKTKKDLTPAEQNCLSELEQTIDSFQQIIYYQKSPEGAEQNNFEVNKEFNQMCDSQDPAVIVATEGALYQESASTAVATKIFDEPNSKIIVVTYQDEDAPAERIVDSMEAIEKLCAKFNKVEEPLLAKVEQIKMRSHILPKALATLLAKMQEPNAILVHGTRESQIHLSNVLKQYNIQPILSRNSEGIAILKGSSETPQPTESKEEAEGTKIGEKEELATPPIQSEAPEEAEVAQKADLPSEGERVFQELKGRITQSSTVAASKISELDAPSFEHDQKLAGTAQTGYYAGQTVFINPEIPQDWFKTALLHLITHYIMDTLNIGPKEATNFQDKVFVEGAAEYIASLLSGKAIADCTNIADDGQEYPTDKNPYLEGFRRFLLIERTFGLAKILELITGGTRQEFERLLSEPQTMQPPTTSQEQAPHYAQPLTPPARPPLPPSKGKTTFAPKSAGIEVTVRETKHKFTNLKLLIIISIVVAAVIVAYFFFLSPQPTVEQRNPFTINGLPSNFAIGEYPFTLNAQITDAPMLVDTDFVVSSSGYSFTDLSQVQLVISGYPQLRDPLNVTLIDYDKDGYIDWVAKTTWEFYSAGSFNWPSTLKVFAPMTGLIVQAFNLTVHTTPLLAQPANITFTANGLSELPAEETVIVIDDNTVSMADLPKTFTWDFGSQHTVQWIETFGTDETRYALSKVEGLTNQTSTTIIVPSLGGEINASYAKQHLVTITILGNGNTSLPETSWAATNTMITITASANATNKFVKWTVNEVDYTQSTLEINVTVPLHITAYFHRLFNLRFACSITEVTSAPILKVDNETYYSAQLPKVFIWEEEMEYYFEWMSPVASTKTGTRWTWTATSGLATDPYGTLLISEAGNITATYTQELLVKLATTVGGTTDPEAGEIWTPVGAAINFTAYPDYNYAFDHWLVNTNVRTQQSIVVTVNAPYNITAYFTPAMIDVTFTIEGFEELAKGIILEVDGLHYGYRDLPCTFSWPAYSVHTYTFYQTVNSSITGKRYRIVDVDGSASPVNVTEPIVINGRYYIQWLVTIQTAGIDDPANNTIVTVNDQPLNGTQLPYAFWVDKDEAIYYLFSGTVASTRSDKQFGLQTVSGPESPATISAITTITGNYGIQWFLTFNTTGLTDQAYGTVVTVNGIEITTIDLPYSFWAIDNTLVTYVYSAVVPSVNTGERFALTSTTGPASPFRARNPKNITGNYITQYCLSIIAYPPEEGTTNPVPGDYWINANTSYPVKATTYTGYTFDGWTLDEQPAGNNTRIYVYMNQSHTLQANFEPTSTTTLQTFNTSEQHRNTETLVTPATIKRRQKQ